MAGLTKSQSECLTFIRAYQARNGYSPSYDEIMEGIGQASKSGVWRLVRALAERGHIRVIPNRSRCIEVVDDHAFKVLLSDTVSRRVKDLAYAEGRSSEALISDIVQRFIGQGQRAA